jgi:transglutaminase-like putative cysteine protease
LLGDPVVDCTDPHVAAFAQTLRGEHPDDVAFSSAAFDYVRDSVAHSWDVQDRRVTISASETLREGVGLCYSKAHLMAALLRVGGIPAGLCYQRLTDHGASFVVHGLISVFLGGAWRRQDPRGGEAGAKARFSIDEEQLAWRPRAELGELDYPDVFARPHPLVLAALMGAGDALALCASGLPSAL